MEKERELTKQDIELDIQTILREIGINCKIRLNEQGTPQVDKYV